jgi:hypothetical protein
MNQGIAGDDTESEALMLILDVRMQWSSMHQMLCVLLFYISAWHELGHALDYHNAIDLFAAWNKDLHAYELSEADWTLIDLVFSWLKFFCSATTQMSATKVPMLSTTHTIFQGLQGDIKGILCSLSTMGSPHIKHGLIDVHMKLSDYYHKYDKSPFYTWAACMLFI